MTTPIDTETQMQTPPLLTLPTDISLHILAYLSLTDLYHLRLTSRQVHAFFEAHEESIYHQAAILHRFVRPRTSSEDAAETHEWLASARGWKELCRRRVILERNWDGRGFVREGGFRTSENSVVDFVIDEEQNTLIALSRRGGLVVRALEDGRLLWALSDQYVATTRCQLSNGFLVFPAKHSGLEIWRRTADIRASTLRRHGQEVATPVVAPAVAAVRDFQVQAGTFAPVAMESDRGHFVPHAYIDTDSSRPLFRVTYPLLAYIRFADSDNITVVDVTSGEVLWRVSVASASMRGMPPLFAFPPSADRIAMDIDLTRTHLCVCMYTVAVVFRLPPTCTSDDPGAANAQAEDGPPEMFVLGDIDTPAARQTTAHRLKPSDAECTDPVPVAIHSTSLPALITARGDDALQRLDVVPPPQSALAANMHALIQAGAPPTNPGFVCARFSPDGKHLVAGTTFGQLYLAWDFARVERGLLFDQFTEHLLIGTHLRSVEWGPAGDVRRLVMRTASEEVFLLTMNASYHDPRSISAFTRPTIKRDAVAHRLRDFKGSEHGQGVPFHGMQLTHTTLWLVWDASLLVRTIAKRQVNSHDEFDRYSTMSLAPGPGLGSVCFVDFTPGL